MESKTIIILTALASFINCILIIPYNKQHFSATIQYHLYAQGCFVAAFFLFAIDGMSEKIAIANCGILFGGVLEVLAIMKLCEKYSERIKNILLMGIGIVVILQAGLLIVVDLSSIRIALVTTTSGILWLYASYLLFAGRNRTTLQFLIGILLVIIVVASGFRVFEALTYEGTYVIYTKGTAQTLTFLSTFTFMIVSGSGIVLLAKEKADEQLRIIATYDELTEVFNRRHFILEAEKAISFANRHNTPFSLLMLDIDHFKNINDSFGHQSGDSVLQLFVNTLKSELRQYDLVGRIGGDEFLIFLQSISKEDAHEVAERIRKSVALKELNGVHFTTSIGIFSMDPNEIKDNNFDEIYRQSDIALYEAKNSGRNRIVQRRKE
jgi:diguanylate cyclase (GGDEF)-like protein